MSDEFYHDGNQVPYRGRNSWNRGGPPAREGGGRGGGFGECKQLRRANADRVVDVVQDVRDATVEALLFPNAFLHRHKHTLTRMQVTCSLCSPHQPFVHARLHADMHAGKSFRCVALCAICVLLQRALYILGKIRRCDSIKVPPGGA